METKKVQVLMSTYNGERFLSEQIESLLSQTWKNLEILIRDDGSRDKTPDILRQYGADYKNIRIFLEENQGINGSFFELLKKSDADYVAFCDQDDIWLEGKIEAAVEKLEQETGPALYCSNKILVDSDGVPMAKQDNRRRIPGFGNAVVECICTGCTTVMNREMADIIVANMPRAFIKYRQHEENVVGGGAGFWSEVRLKAAYLRKNRGRLEAQLTDFAKLYHGDGEKDALVQEVLAAKHFSGKIKILWNRRIYRQSRLDGLIMRMLFLFGGML